MTDKERLGLRLIAAITLLLCLGYHSQLQAQTSQLDREIEEALGSPAATGQLEEGAAPVGSVADWASNPRILIAVDMVGDWNLGQESEENSEEGGGQREPAQDNANIREVELGFSTAIDQWALGTVLFAVHNEAGEYFVELHEAYFEFNQLPLNLFFKLGAFFIDVGRLNSIHRHDWKFTNAPLVHEELFAEEAVSDFGGELSLLMPWSFYQELKVGVFNGQTFGHTHGEGVKKPNPLYSGRLKHFFLLGGGIGSQLGFSYLRYNIDDDPDNYWQMGGIDITLSWRKGGQQGLEWTTELWYRDQAFAVGENSIRYGYYSSAVYRPVKRWSLGTRWDHFVRQDDFDGSLGKEIDKDDYGQSLWATFHPSEFSYFRLTLERKDLYAEEDDYILIAQADFIIGYHPPHKY